MKKNIFEQFAIDDLIEKETRDFRKKETIKANIKAATPILKELTKLFDIDTGTQYDDVLAVYHRKSTNGSPLVSVCLREKGILRIGNWGDNDKAPTYPLSSLKKKETKKKIFDLFKKRFAYREDIKTKVKDMPSSVKFMRE